MTVIDRNYKFLYIASSLVLSFAFIFIVLLGYLLFVHDNPPIIINSLSLDKDSYFAGEQLNITADICRRTTSGATLYPTFINVNTFQLFDALPVFVDRIPAGCNTSTIQVLIPHYLPPGTYVRQIRARYRVNFLTERVVEFTTEEFEITEREINSDE